MATAAASDGETAPDGLFLRNSIKRTAEGDRVVIRAFSPARADHDPLALDAKRADYDPVAWAQNTCEALRLRGGGMRSPYVFDWTAIAAGMHA